MQSPSFYFVVALTLATNACSGDAGSTQTPTPGGTEAAGGIAKLYTAPVKTIDGENSSLSSFRGKALLVVNVASRCGYTPQYEALEELHKRYAERGFSVVGFPCNQFGGQEPGSAAEIKSFCRLNYGVTFPLFEKIEVNGSGRHAIYEVLTEAKDPDGVAGDVRWNFEKFVISADGTKISRFRSATKPNDPSVIAAIEAALPGN